MNKVAQEVGKNANLHILDVNLVPNVSGKKYPKYML